VQQWTSGFNKMWGTSSVAEELLVFQVEFYSMELGN
jgi:hypothetical protein